MNDDILYKLQEFGNQGGDWAIQISSFVGNGTIYISEGWLLHAGFENQDGILALQKMLLISNVLMQESSETYTGVPSISRRINDLVVELLAGTVTVPTPHDEIKKTGAVRLQSENSCVGNIGDYEIYLVFVGGELDSYYFDLKPGCNSLGSAADNTCVVPDETISRYHCEVMVGPNEVYVRDLGSTNGVRLNGAIIDKGALAPSDHLQLSKVLLRVDFRLKRHLTDAGQESPMPPMKPNRLSKTQALSWKNFESPENRKKKTMLAAFTQILNKH